MPSNALTENHNTFRRMPKKPFPCWNDALKIIRTTVYPLKAHLLVAASNLIFEIYRCYRKCLRKDKYHINMLSLRLASSFKRADTLFILCSGSSILSLSEDNWRAISGLDSIGFNFSYLLRHVPTFYLCELARTATSQSTCEKISADLLYLAYEYSQTLVMVKPFTPNILFNIRSLWSFRFYNAFFLPQLFATENSLRWFCFRFKMMLRQSHLLPYSFPSPHYVHRATLEQAVSFGIALNYKEIVICGADLGGKYFFECESDAIRANLHRPSREHFDSVPIDKPHGTADPIAYGLTIDKVLALMSEVASSNSINIYVSSKHSPLSGLFPVYSWPSQS